MKSSRKKKNNYPTPEELEASARKYAERHSIKEEIPSEELVQYTKKVRKLESIMNPNSIQDVIKSFEHLPTSFKIVPEQLMQYEEAAKLFYVVLKQLLATENKTFVMNGNKEKVYRMISQYIALDRNFEIENPGMSLGKGLCLYGRYGTGKSMVMQALDIIFRKLSVPFHSFKRTTCKVVVMQVNEKQNISAINSYLKGQWCFDDLGHERSMLNLFGNRLNVMEDVMTERYIEFVERGIKTHLTSNLAIKDPDEICEIYGERIRNRFDQMFNFIYMGGESLRR